jgi:hypothetical protein
VVQFVFHDGIHSTHPISSLIEQANRRLEEVLGPSAYLVSAEWDRGEDSFGREVLVLRLSDASSSVIATFDPKELEQPDQLRDRFRRLWGDLLQLRSRKQLEAVLGVGEPRGE